MVKRTDSERQAFNKEIAIRPTYNIEDRAYNTDLALVAARLRLGCIIYDSAPFYPTHLSSRDALRHGFPRYFDQFKVKTAAAIIVWWKGKICRVLFSKKYIGSAKNFWINMEQSNLTNRQAYIYSEGDSISDWKNIRALIRFRKRRMGNDVTSLKFSYSGHIGHLEMHKDKYESLIDAELDAISPEDPDRDCWSSDDEKSL